MFHRPLAACLVLAASPALADLTAEEVLVSQLNLLSGDGAIEARTTGVTPAADGLTVQGYRLTFTAEGADHTVDLSGTRLVEQGDGTVRIVYPDRFTVTMTSEGENVDIDEATFVFAFDGLTHVVSGSVGDTCHAIAVRRAQMTDYTFLPETSAPPNLDFEVALNDASTILRLSDRAPMRREVTAEIGEAVLSLALPDDPGDAFGELDTLDATIRLTGLSAQGSYIGTAIPESALDLTFDRFDWRQTMSGDDLDAFDVTMQAQDFALSFDAAMSLDALDEDFPAALRAGQRVEGRISYTAMSFDMEGETPDGFMKSASAAGQSSGSVRLDRSGFTMIAEARDQTAEFELPSSPGMTMPPVAYAIARSAMDIDIPFLPSDAPQPFRFRFAITGIEAAETLWSLIDPNRLIPRDPAGFEIDIDGTTIIDTSLLEADQGEVPFRDTRARLNTLRLTVGGAEVTATGEAEGELAGDVPEGTARLDARITGAYGLIDTLVELGLLTDDMAMPARMGLGFIGRPAGDPDTLTSTIEARSDGTIFANGQRIR